MAKKGSARISVPLEAKIAVIKDAVDKYSPAEISKRQGVDEKTIRRICATARKEGYKVPKFPRASRQGFLDALAAAGIPRSK